MDSTAHSENINCTSPLESQFKHNSRSRTCSKGAPASCHLQHKKPCCIKPFFRRISRFNFDCRPSPAPATPHGSRETSRTFSGHAARHKRHRQPNRVPACITYSTQSTRSIAALARVSCSEGAGNGTQSHARSRAVRIQNQPERKGAIRP